MTNRNWRPTPPRWLAFLREHSAERNVSLLLRYLTLLVLSVVAFSVAFVLLMRSEGRQYEWWVGLYWSVSTMTTLGLGDLAFEQFPGRVLTVAGVLAGVMFMLVGLPLVLIQFPPWVEARSAARVRRRLPRDLAGHVLITTYEPVAAELIRKLEQFHYPYALLVPEIEEALRLEQQGVSVILGAHDLPETYRNARLEQAALLVVNGSDIKNPNTIFTARGVAADVPILALTKRPEMAAALEVAGCTHKLQVSMMLGRALGRRVIGGDALTHEIGDFGNLIISEATASKTPLVGKTLGQSRLRELVDVGVVGTWERGEFRLAEPETLVGPHTMLVLAGTREQMLNYDELFAIYNVSEEPVLVIGGGVVGQATAKALEFRGIACRILDRNPSVLSDKRGIHGDAADVEVLERAGIDRAPAAVITTHDDDTNVFLTLYCRRLRPDMQIVSRATYERNVETMHRAGADSVVSLTSLGANAILNVLERGEVLTISEGLELFKVEVPPGLVGRTLAGSGMREETGCSVVAKIEDGDVDILPSPSEPLRAGVGLILIGSRAAERKFLERYETRSRERIT